MKQRLKKLSAMLMAVLMLASLAVIPASAEDIYVYKQSGESWSSYQYSSIGDSSQTIGSSGCGLMALVNAVYYLNEIPINPTFLADYSVQHGYRTRNDGTAHGLFEAFLRDYGSQLDAAYVGSVWGYDNLRSHLNQGRAAICYNATHVMAIGAYRSSDGRYLLLDSAPAAKRGTSGSGYAWKTQSELSNIGLRSTFYIIRSTRARFNGQCAFTTALNSNMALDVYGNYSDSGTNIQIYPVHWGAAQQFNVQHVGKGWHKIIHRSSGKVLDVEGAIADSGTNVILWDYNGGPNQLWKIIPSGGGYRIVNKMGTYLDVCGGATNPETNVWAYEGNGTNAQLWYINWYA